MDIFISDYLKNNCTFETGECFYSTIPSNKKEKYENIIIPIGDDGMLNRLFNFDSSDSLYQEVLKALKNNTPIVITYPRKLFEENNFEIIQKRRQKLSDLMKMGYKVLPFDKLNEVFETTIRS